MRTLLAGLYGNPLNFNEISLKCDGESINRVGNNNGRFSRQNDTPVRGSMFSGIERWGFMARKYFGTDGIRGRANGVITPELALKVGQATGVVFRRPARTVIAW